MKKTLLTISLLLLAKLAAFAVVDLGTTTDHTPYDRYLSPVKEVFSEMHGAGATMDKVQAAMRTGRAFRYAHTEPYLPATPQETATRRTGDCKDKALWLMDQLQDPSARFVIGKMTRGAKLSHAWVMWQHDGQWWILDCTMLSRPIPADKAGANEYVPLYSYSRSSAFRHSDKAGLTADVAGKSANRVAANN
ncbi:MAG: hypothetical protein WDN28_32685 [Chthoniobacter sp.]